MKMFLDLTDCAVCPWWPENTPRKIPIRSGMHLKEFDIIDSEMPEGWRERYNFLVGAQPHHKLLPIGFDKSKLPKGAKIVREDEIA